MTRLLDRQSSKTEQLAKLYSQLMQVWLELESARNAQKRKRLETRERTIAQSIRALELSL